MARRAVVNSEPVRFSNQDTQQHRVSFNCAPPLHLELKQRAVFSVGVGRFAAFVPPPWPRAAASEAKLAASMLGGEDRISALPDGVLQHVLGFLPARDAVQTSVLAGRWRHAWRSIRRLHLSPDDGWDSDKPEHLKDFFDALLSPGDHDSILEEAKLDFDDWSKITRTPKLGSDEFCPAKLRKLEFTEMVLEGDVLDFASCPALEDLKMADCRLHLDKISSQSVKRLNIDSCYFFCDCRPIPFLESMPSLETAFVKPAAYSRDCCIRGAFKECCGICAECTGDGDHGSRCVLLGALFGRDLRWCPTFSNLKTLLLNEWCVATDFRALLCILEHSPVLEKLILRLSKRREFITVLSYPLEKLPAISKHLNIVEIRCGDVDGRVCRILKLLSRFVSAMQINIKLVAQLSTCFSFETWLWHFPANDDDECNIIVQG
uniref:F-box domain-containing protein n=1 Tax=Aegilops tauschii TaxID=37682 RepID=R7W7Q1_AEGTA